MKKFIRAGVQFRHKYVLSGLVVLIKSVNGDKITCEVKKSNKNELIGKSVSYSNYELNALFDFENIQDKFLDLQFRFED